jgi:hypothetical protein
LAIGIGLLGLTALVLPQAFGFLAVIVGFFAFGAINYLIWGWWLQPARMCPTCPVPVPRGNRPTVACSTWSTDSPALKFSLFFPIKRRVPSQSWCPVPVPVSRSGSGVRVVK